MHFWMNLNIYILKVKLPKLIPPLIGSVSDGVVSIISRHLFIAALLVTRGRFISSSNNQVTHLSSYHLVIYRTIPVANLPLLALEEKELSK